MEKPVLGLLSQSEPLVLGERPTNVRRRVVAFGSAIAFLSFLDRAAISQSAPAISKDLHLSAAQMGLAFSAFAFAYALGELPSGWLCDRFGARILLTRVIFLWSLFTAATGWVFGFGSCTEVVESLL